MTPDEKDTPEYAEAVWAYFPSRGSKSVKIYADPMCLYLWELLDYNELTGEFRWKVNRSRARAGNAAGHLHSDGRLTIRIDGNLYYAHRIAWLMGTGYWPVDEIDHRNRIPHDNRLRNLREATHAQNMQNLSMKSNNTSGYMGVSLYSPTGKWRAEIVANRKLYLLGHFDTPEAAHEAYKKAKRELHTFNPKTD